VDFLSKGSAAKGESGMAAAVLLHFVYGAGHSARFVCSKMGRPGMRYDAQSSSNEIHVHTRHEDLKTEACFRARERVLSVQGYSAFDLLLTSISSC
jgi:hypothetical protein